MQPSLGGPPSVSTGVNGVLLLSESPIVGTRKYQLTRLLSRAGLEGQAFWIGGPDQIATCHPKVIVPLGEHALRVVTGEFNILRFRGRVLRHSSGAWVVPTLAPADLYPQLGGPLAERNPSRFTGCVLWDIQKAVQIAKEGFSRREPFYQCDPTPSEFAAFALAYEGALASDRQVMLSWDIETPYKIRASDEGEFDEGERDNTILRISFAFRPFHAVSVPWSGPYLGTIKRLLANKGVQVGWNVDGFDIPLVRSQGVEVLGEIHDFMWGFHLYQSDLPKGLEFATSFFTDLLPWKHLNNADPARYSCIDADAALRNAIGIKAALQKAGQWGTFLNHVVRLAPILREAGDRGSLIDREKQAEMTLFLGGKKAALIEEAQSMVPRELKPRKVWKKFPLGERDLDEMLVAGKVKFCDRCVLQISSKGAHQKGKKNPCKGAGVLAGDGLVPAWEEVLPFNPNSTQQIMSYIRHFKHPMGYDIRDRTKESANSKHLVRLSKRFVGHPIYALTVELHKVSKALGTYVVGFTPDERGLIHTTYDHTPSTWRLASKNVNLQNVGKSENNPYAKEARKQIIARPGHIFVQADSSAIEAVFVGWFMGDPDYIATARKGVHAKLACYKLGIPFTDGNIALVKDKHADLYRRCKITVHGTSYGMTTGLMCENNPSLFPTRKVAETFQNLLFEMAPKLKVWQHELRVRANKESSLLSPWKYRHSFYAVFGVDMNGEVKQGPDGNRVVAFLPQNSAGAFMQDNLVLVGESWARPYLPAHLSVHDSICLEVPRDLEQQAIELLVEILTRPIPEMGGLRVGCEVEVGVNWGEMETVRTVMIEEKEELSAAA